MLYDSPEPDSDSQSVCTVLGPLHSVKSEDQDSSGTETEEVKERCNSPMSIATTLVHRPKRVEEMSLTDFEGDSSSFESDFSDSEDGFSLPFRPTNVGSKIADSIMSSPEQLALDPIKSTLANHSEDFSDDDWFMLDS